MSPFRRSLAVSLATALAGCSPSSREVMFEIDRYRVAAEKSLTADDVAGAREQGRRIADALGRDIIVTRWDEARYRELLGEARRLSGDLTRAQDKKSARGALMLLEHACQKCHDEYQYRKKP